MSFGVLFSFVDKSAAGQMFDCGFEIKTEYVSQTVDRITAAATVPSLRKAVPFIRLRVDEKSTVSFNVQLVF